MFFGQYETPVGVFGVLAGPAGVRRLGWRLSASGASTEPDETVEQALGQLRQYFAGERRDFDLPLEWPRLEPTTAAVLQALIGVGYGETVTYGELARRSGTRSEEHTSELQSRQYLVCRFLLEKNTVIR